MELQRLALSRLHFPQEEWKWLRLNVHLNKTDVDTFLWAVNVKDQLWAWHPEGSGVEGIAKSLDTINVLVLDTDGSELQAHGLYLKTTFERQKAQDVEWINALDVLNNRFHYDLGQQQLPPYWDAALQACGLKPHVGVLAGRARYLFLTETERRFLFEKRWDPATFELAETLSPEYCDAFIAALQKWNLSAQQAKEALNFILILAKKFNAEVVKKILESAYRSAEEFRTAVFNTAQPELATLSQRRIDRLRGLRLPPRTSIFSDPSFEKDILKLTHNPRNISDFEAFKTWVADPETTQKMQQLLEIYQ